MAFSCLSEYGIKPRFFDNSNDVNNTIIKNPKLDFYIIWSNIEYIIINLGFKLSELQLNYILNLLYIIIIFNTNEVTINIWHLLTFIFNIVDKRSRYNDILTLFHLQTSTTSTVLISPAPYGIAPAPYGIAPAPYRISPTPISISGNWQDNGNTNNYSSTLPNPQNTPSQIGRASCRERV